MARDNDINIIIKLKNLASNELKKVSNGFTTAGKSAKGFGGAVNNLASFLASKFVITLGDVQRLLGGIVNFFKKSSDASQEQEDAINKLNTALKNQGIYTREVTNQLQKQATELQKVTKYGDEQILQLKAQFINFGILPEQIEKVTLATLDLATAQGMDLITAGNLIAKSLGSSTNALSRYGIEITGAVGSTERLDTAVKNISERFGGQAKSATEVARGTYAQLGNQLGDLREKFGDMVNMAFLPFAKAIKSVVTNINSAIDATKELREENDIFMNVLNKLGIQQEETSKKAKKEAEKREKQEKETIEKQKMALINAGNFTKEQLSKLTDEELMILRELAKQIEDDMQNNDREAIKSRSGYYQTLLEYAKQNGLNIIKEENIIAEIKKREDEKKAKERKAELEKQAEEEKKNKEEQAQKEKEILISTKEEELEFLRQTNQLKLEEELKYYEDLLLLAEGNADKQKEIQEKINNIKLKKRVEDYNNSKKFSDSEIDIAKNTIDELTKLKNAGSKEAFEIGKAASLAQAIINTSEAITKTMASVPYPLNIPLAGAQAVAGAGEVAKISATQFADGGVVKAQQGGVAGSINGLPSTVAENRSDEAIIPLEDDARVKELMGGGQTVVNLIVDGQKLAQAVVNGYNKGRAINTVTKIKEK